MDRHREMAAFVRVVEAGSFSAAARNLKIGQPSVSKLIAQLERRLQVKLIVRSTHRLAPTEAGLRFFEHALIAVREAEEAEHDARGAGTGLSGRLRVSAALTFARLHIIPHLPGFLDRNPGIEVDMILDDRLVDMIAEGIDLALRVDIEPEPSSVARRLATSRRSVVATQNYIDRAGEPRSPADLAAHQAVVFTRMSDAWPFRRGDVEIAVTLSGRLRVSAAEGQRAAVLAGMGLAIASDWMFAREIADGTVQRLLRDWTLPGIDLWATFPAGRMASAKARAFANFVGTIVGEQ